MKKSSILLAGSLLFTPFSILANSVNINIHGYITALPCVIEKSSQLIELGRFNSWNYRDTPSTPWKDFTIKFNNCPVNTKNIKLSFMGNPDPFYGDYFLNTGTARNVALNLATQNEKTLIKNGSQLTYSIDDISRATEVPLSARIMSYGDGMEAGSFKSYIQFDILYQ